MAMKTKTSSMVMMVMLTTNSDMLGNPVEGLRQWGLSERALVFVFEVFFDRLHVSHRIGIDLGQKCVEFPLAHVGAAHELGPAHRLIGVLRYPQSQLPKTDFVGV